MKRGLFNFLAGASTMLAVCLAPSQAEAIFASVKATGMAATCISYPLDTLVVAYNPAGITEIGDRLDLEAGWVYNTGSSTVRNNPVPGVNGTHNGMQQTNIFPANIGFNKTWLINCEWQLDTGIVVYNRNYQKTSYKTPLPLFGTSKPGIEYLNETISPVFAVKWRNAHSLGISVNFQVERLKVNGLQRFDRPVIPGIPGGSLFPGDVTNRGYNYSTGWGFTVGYRGQITDELAIGVTYQPKTTMTRLNKYKGFLAGGRLNVPSKIGAGVSYRIMPCVVVAFDAEFIKWSDVKSLHNPLLHDGTLEALGSSNGPGFGFRDQWYYRTGVEWTMNENLTLRAGYRYAETPVRKSQAAVNVLLLDLVESFITAGATWKFNACNEVSLVGAYGFENEVKGTGSIPAVFGGGDVKIREQKFAIGLAWGYNY